MAKNKAQIEIEVENRSAIASIQDIISSTQSLNRQLIQARYGFEVQGQILSGAFQAATGQAQQLEKQILSLTGTFASLNSVASGGVNLGDPLAKIDALQPAIEQSIAKVREISLAISGVTSSELVGVFQTIATNSSYANLTLSQSVDLVKSFSAGLVAANIPLFQQRQEIDSILKGQITQDSALAKQLGITNEIVAREKARGTLVEYLNERLKTSVVIQDKISKTIEGVTSNIKELGELTQSAFGGQLLKPITDTLTTFYNFLDANKDKIFGFAQFLGNQFVKIGETLKVIFDAIAPRLAAAGELLGSLATSSIQSFTGAFSALGSVLATIDGALNVVLIPTLKALNSDLGQVIIQAGLFTYAINAGAVGATIRLAESLLGIITSTASFVGSSVIRIGTLIAETATSDALDLSLGKLITTQQILAGTSAGPLAAGAAGAATLATALITVTVGLVAAGLAYEKYMIETAQFIEQNEKYSAQSDKSVDDSNKIVNSLKNLAAQKAKNGTLSKEEEEQFKKQTQLSKIQVVENNNQIANLKVQISENEKLRETLAPKIKLLEKENELLSSIATKALPVAKIGDAYSYLAQQAKTALNVINEGVNQEDFDRRSKEILDITKQQVELGVVTREEGIKQLQVLANAENAKVELRASANKQILALIKDLYKEEIALNKQQQIDIEQLSANGYITELEGLEKISELKKKVLERDAETTRKANKEIAEKNIKERFDALTKAEQALNDLRNTPVANDAASEINRANRLKNIERIQIEISNIKKTFDEKDLKAQQKSSEDEAKIRDDALKQQKEDLDKKVKFLRGSLDRELEENGNLRKKAEFSIQADIQALRLGGFENDKQLEEQTLLLKKQTIESELADKRLSLEVDKTNLANFRGSQAEKEALILKISKTELDIAKLNLDATDNLIARTKVLYDVKIMGIEREKDSLDKVSKLLQSQNDLQTARIALTRAVQDAELKGGENRLAGLRDVAALLKQNSDFVADKAKRDVDERTKIEREAILSKLSDEQKAEKQKQFQVEDSARAEAEAKDKQAKSDAINLEKQKLLRARLNELGFSAGQDQLSLARSIFEQEQKNLELKARQFESTQIAEQRSLAIQQQQADIKDRQLNTEAKLALLRAQESGREDLIKSALELVNLTDNQISNNKELYKIQTETLAVKQKSDLETFNLGQGNEQYKARLAGVEAGLSANSVIGSSPDINATAYSYDRANRKGQVIIPLASEQGATDAIKKDQDVNVKKVLDARSQNLANVANGTVAFEGTSDRVAQNFERLPKALKATADGLRETINYAKELSENPIFKSRVEAAKVSAESNKQLAKESAKLQYEANPVNKIVNRLFNTGLPETQYKSQSGDLVNARLDLANTTKQNAETKAASEKVAKYLGSPNGLGGLVGSAFLGGSTPSARIEKLSKYVGIVPSDRIVAAANEPEDSDNYKAYIKAFEDAYVKSKTRQNGTFSIIDEKTNTENVLRQREANRKRLGLFTGGYAPADVPVTVNEQGQEAVTNLRTGETSLLPYGERQVMFGDTSYVHNAYDTRQMLAANSTAEPKTDLVLDALSRLHDLIAGREAKLAVTNNFTNDAQPDRRVYEVTRAMMRAVAV